MSHRLYQREAVKIEKKCYVLYKTSKIKAGCSFLHPSDWVIEEAEIDGHNVISMAPKPRESSAYTASFVVRVSKAIEETPETAANLFVSRLRPDLGSRELGRACGMISENVGVELEVSYSIPRDLSPVNPQLITIRERRIFFKRGEELFQLSYKAPEEEFMSWLEDFAIFVRTIIFSDHAPGSTFRPLVTTPSNKTEKP